MARRDRWMTKGVLGAIALAWLGATASGVARAQTAAADPDARAAAIGRQMTLDDKIALVRGFFPQMMKPLPDGVVMSAGYFPGIPRLGIPALRETDASLGVARAGRGDDDDATALPSSLSLAATWDLQLAYEGGAMIGREARQKGFNVLLAGGVNLTRDAYNGRNFEYLGEDPLLAGSLAGASIKGIQSNHIVSTVKHYLLNSQETGRIVLDARIGEAALRESDLLAFEIAIEKGDPGSVMCSYNHLNGLYACENPFTLTQVLRRDWGWKGWVMSDWGAVHSVESAAAGLDQESGAQLDKQVYFDGPLRAAVAGGAVPPARLEEMVHRILRGMIANGLIDHPVMPGGLDTQADGAVARKAGAAGIVLLKNDGGLLPLAASARRIVVIGAHADQGVLSGGGSSQVVPRGSLMQAPPAGTPKWLTGLYYHPSAPVTAIRARAPDAQVVYDAGTDPAAAAALAKGADVVVLMAQQWASEGVDTSLSLSADQEALIAAVTAANPKTVVVLETGGPVLMPWLPRVGAVVEAWYPGGRGGEAIADVLFGQADPAGRLPMSFPASLDQMPRPAPVGQEKVSTPIDYTEGSSVGYRRFAETGKAPLFPFGYGLTYTHFSYSDLKVAGGDTLTVSLAVTNTGRRSGTETAQVYLRQGPGRRQQRLIGWSKVMLQPGETKRVEIAADRRLLANWEMAAHGWKLEAGHYEVFAGPNAGEAALQGAADVKGATLKP
jgi:beta-glucosidase